MNEIVIREWFLEYLQQRESQEVVSTVAAITGIPGRQLRRFRDGRQGVLTTKELGLLEQFLMETVRATKPKGLREALRVLLTVADATFLCDELAISFDLLKGVAEGKDFLASQERIRLWGLIEKSRWDVVGASKLKDRIWQANTTTLFADMEKATGVYADTITSFLDGDGTLWFDEVERIVGWLESLENTKEDTTMKEDVQVQAELEYFLGDAARKQFEDLLASEAEDNGELLKGFIKVAQMVQWGSNMGLHVGVEEEGKWVVSFPDPKSKERVEVFRGESMKDLVLILSTVRLTKGCFGLQGEKGDDEKEEDLVVPRVLEYE